MRLSLPPTCIYYAAGPSPTPFSTIRNARSAYRSSRCDCLYVCMGVCLLKFEFSAWRSVEPGGPSWARTPSSLPRETHPRAGTVGVGDTATHYARAGTVKILNSVEARIQCIIASEEHIHSKTEMAPSGMLQREWRRGCAWRD